jgi:tetratricopeptide (TPR) repeat protein
MAYAALLGVISRQLSMSQLERCPIADMPEQVTIAIRHSLLSRTSERRCAIKIHDIVRDAVLRTLEDEVMPAAASLFDHAYQDESWVDAAFFAMFADPSVLGEGRFDLAFGVAVNAAVESRDYALLANLLFRAQQSARVLEFLNADQDRYDLFCYARASQLAASGNYSDAEDVLYGSSIARRRVARADESAALRSELSFLQADLAHLLNRYDEAAEMFAALGESAAATGQTRLEARCIWAQAHVLRHQGRELGRSLTLFANAARLAESCNELFVKVHSVTGACGIRVALGALAEDEESLLLDAERQVATAVSHDGYMLRIWKAQARVAWARGSIERAWEIIDAAIDKALAVNDRALHNLRFERAEFHRLSRQPEEALVGYLQARQFAEEEGDRNLLASCLLGLVLTDVAAADWVHFETAAAARAAALEARDVALAADVQMTAQVAEQIVSMLDAPSPDASSDFRLIVF